MNLGYVRNPESVFHQNIELAPSFFCSLTLRNKSLVLFTANIRGYFVHVFLGVYAYRRNIGIVPPWELAPHQINA